MTNSSTKKILVLGSRWSGKSLLIKRLEELSSSNKISQNEFLSTTITVGQTLTTLHYKRNEKIEIHEVGGTLASLWNSFYSNAHFEKILFVIDLTQTWSMASVSEQLREINDQTTIGSKQILLVLNKCKQTNAMNSMTVRELLDLKTLWKGEVSFIETDARTGANLSALLEWITR